MKLFTINEANEHIVKVRPVLKRIQAIYGKVGEFRDDAAAASESAESGGGGMEGGSQYVKLLFELGKHTSELDQLGIQLKDYGRGLIDFPSERGGKIVLLCWQLDEGDQIRWWHDLEAGFAGRQPLDSGDPE